MKLTKEEANVFEEFEKFREELIERYDTMFMCLSMRAEHDEKAAEKLKKIHESVKQIKRQALRNTVSGMDTITLNGKNCICIHNDSNPDYLKETVITAATDFLVKFSKYVGRISLYDSHNAVMNYKKQLADAQDYVSKILIIMTKKK